MASNRLRAKRELLPDLLIIQSKSHLFKYLAFAQAEHIQTNNICILRFVRDQWLCRRLASQALVIFKQPACQGRLEKNITSGNRMNSCNKIISRSLFGDVA